jgi:hypothetical protein
MTPGEILPDSIQSLQKRHAAWKGSDKPQLTDEERKVIEANIAKLRKQLADREAAGSEDEIAVRAGEAAGEAVVQSS